MEIKIWESGKKAGLWQPPSKRGHSWKREIEGALPRYMRRQRAEMLKPSRRYCEWALTPRH